MARVARLVVLFGSLVAVALWLGWRHELSRPLREADDPPQLLVVEPGASAAAIGVQLYGLGLLRHPAVFRLAVARDGAGSDLKAGAYSLEGRMSLRDVIALLVRGQVVRHDITIPEGRNMAQVVEIVKAHGLDAEAFRRAAADPAPITDLDAAAGDLEGYLFPETYEVPRGEGAAEELVARMLQQFRRVIEGERARLATSGFDVRQIVTLASLVELETAQPDERSRIAGVFLNRLRRGMPLQTDPTVIYAMRLEGRYEGRIRKRDLEIDSPYNTYRHRGLPPGPIASPGRAAIEAVLAPASTEDLYFVSRNDGSHQFSRTLREHERAVDEYQRRRPRPGPESG